jgi:hypothetical protein
VRSLARIRQGKLRCERTSSRNHKFEGQPPGFARPTSDKPLVYIGAHDGESNLACRLQGRAIRALQTHVSPVASVFRSTHFMESRCSLNRSATSGGEVFCNFLSSPRFAIKRSTTRLVMPRLFLQMR